MIEMTVNGKARHGRRAFYDVDTFKDQKQALEWLRLSFGEITDSTDAEHISSLHLMGVTVSFKDV